jgi:hypothetical protein
MKGREKVAQLVVGDTVVRAGDLQKYCDETFYSAMEVWGMTKAWKLANGAIGWANEPMEYIQAITILESESNAIQQEEMEARQEKMKASSTARR